MAHFASLQAPRAISTNIFFDQVAPALNGAVRAQDAVAAAAAAAGAAGAAPFGVPGMAAADAMLTVGEGVGEYAGVAQTLPITLRREALEALRLDVDVDNGASLVFVQSVAVVPSSRRRGVGAALMAWAEESARDGGATELWLAVDQNAAPARALHESRGFEVVTAAPAFGNILMRKQVGAAGGGGAAVGAPAAIATTAIATTAAAAAATPFANSATVAATDDDDQARPGPSPTALLKELSGQAVVLTVAALGITALISPLGGRSVPELISGGLGGPVSVVLGVGAGLGSEALRRAVTGDANDGDGTWPVRSRVEFGIRHLPLTSQVTFPSCRTASTRAPLTPLRR